MSLGEKIKDQQHNIMKNKSATNHHHHIIGDSKQLPSVPINQNWNTLRQNLRLTGISHKRRKRSLETDKSENEKEEKRIQTPDDLSLSLGKTILDLFPKVNSQSTKLAGKYVAMDCEMVGIGSLCESALARVSLVNYHGQVLLDEYIKPLQKVTDYRTKITGLTPSILKSKGVHIQSVLPRIDELLKDKILIGHGLSNDFKVLPMSHPHKDIRDTSQYADFRKNFSKGRSPSLKLLAEKLLDGLVIQESHHDSVEDARIAMLIYRKVKHEWENRIRPVNAKSRNKAHTYCVVKSMQTRERASSCNEEALKDESIL